jgi:hypothetical protein
MNCNKLLEEEEVWSDVVKSLQRRVLQYVAMYDTAVLLVNGNKEARSTRFLSSLGIFNG